MPAMNGMDSRPAGDAAGQPDPTAAPAAAVAVEAPGKNRARGSRPARRGQRKHQRAAATVQAAGEDPGLGALNRQLKMVVEQLETAHRLIGRFTAERDALRQQLADLQGVPVEDIVLTTTGPDGETHDGSVTRQETNRTRLKAPLWMSRRRSN
jgi:hypothetical protein